jgi:hypothetical protein
MTTSTSTDTLETVQHYDQRTTLSDALIQHMDAEVAAGITGERQYTIRSNGAGTDWTIKSAPPAPGPITEDFLAVDDFPCCAPGGEGH